MKKRASFALACALGLAGTAAFAAEHEVLMVEGGFFPEITYLSVGDTVIFTNTTDMDEDVVASDASWQTVAIPTNGTTSVLIEEDMNLEFAYDESSEEPKLGSFSFDPPPLAEEDGLSN